MNCRFFWFVIFWLSLASMIQGQSTTIVDWSDQLAQAYSRGDSLARDTALLQLARKHREAGNLPQALRYALEGQQHAADRPGSLAWAFTEQLAAIYQDADLPAAAIPHLEQAVQTASVNGPSSQRRSLLTQLADCHLTTGSPALADSLYLLAMDGVDPFGPSGISLGQRRVNALIATSQLDTACNLLETLLERLPATAPERAILTNNLGFLYHRQERYADAARTFTTALAEDPDASTRCELSIHLAIAEFNQGKMKRAIGRLRDLSGNAPEDQKPRILHILSTMYRRSGDMYQSLQAARQTISQAHRQDQPHRASEAYLTLAGLYTDLAEYETALSYYQRHLSLRDSLRLESRLLQQDIAQRERNLERQEKEIRLLLAAQELRDLTIQQLSLEKEKLRLESDNMSLAAARREDELALLRQQQEIQAAKLENQALEAAQAQQALTLTKQRLEAERKDRKIEALNQLEAMQRMEIAEKEARAEANQQEIAMLQQESQIQELTIQQQEGFRRFALGIGLLLLIILGLIAAGYGLTRRKNRQLAIQNDQIRQQNQEIEANRTVIASEKARSDALLLNILPADTAEELKMKGTATPRRFEQVAVMFTDFQQFTSLTEDLAPEDLIGDLNTYFAAFDEIVAEHGLEKIKTIGDAYMCAGGLPGGNEQGTVACVQAGLDMLSFCQNQAEHQLAAGRPAFTMRIGIHTGPVVAGVVGKHKFAFDIWGDTVNTAARLESAGQAGRVNLSQTAFEAVRDLAVRNIFPCESRGPLAVKNKGKIPMYFVAPVA